MGLTAQIQSAVWNTMTVTVCVSSLGSNQVHQITACEARQRHDAYDSTFFLDLPACDCSIGPVKT